ncbi:hypothetical protein PR048_030622 [Dryococelus australis]|uniref:HNH endonuclease n=1 Tax=Dryococelus australis TaxID=614101 RepID=A0ABQ9G9I4_9NEOP|nr:hypothetical protein PR048_030622 [Dryococelus australis]
MTERQRRPRRRHERWQEVMLTTGPTPYHLPKSKRWKRGREKERSVWRRRRRPNLPWRSRLVRLRSGVPEALGSNPRECRALIFYSAASEDIPSLYDGRGQAQWFGTNGNRARSYIKMYVLRADEGEARWAWSSAGIQVRRKREIPEKTRLSRFPQCENPGVPPPGIENPVHLVFVHNYDRQISDRHLLTAGRTDASVDFELLPAEGISGNTARLARRSDEALGVRVNVARIASSLLRFLTLNAQVHRTRNTLTSQRIYQRSRPARNECSLYVTTRAPVLLVRAFPLANFLLVRITPLVLTILTRPIIGYLTVGELTVSQLHHSVLCLGRCLRSDLIGLHRAQQNIPPNEKDTLHVGDGFQKCSFYSEPPIVCAAHISLWRKAKKFQFSCGDRVDCLESLGFLAVFPSHATCSMNYDRKGTRLQPRQPPQAADKFPRLRGWGGGVAMATRPGVFAPPYWPGAPANPGSEPARARPINHLRGTPLL